MWAQTKEDMVTDQTDCLVNMASTETPPGETRVLFASVLKELMDCGCLESRSNFLGHLIALSVEHPT